MKAMMLVLLFLLLSGCCSHQELEVAGSSDQGIDFYDPNTDIWYSYWFDGHRVTVIRYPNWNHWWKQERNQ